jgi:hypothetical protein
MRKMTAVVVMGVVGLLWGCPLFGGTTTTAPQDSATAKEVSFKNDVMPIIQKYCLPCHAEDNYNPSELSLDTYDQLTSGGKHGSPVVPGKSGESILSKKLHADPPFGKPMPLKRRQQPEQTWVPDDLIKVIADWIDQGAKNN